MTNLEKTVKTVRRELERRVEDKIRQATKNGTLRMWNGRKIVSLEKWEKIESDLDHVFEFIPDDFIEHSMIYYWQLGEEFDKKRDEWYKDYIEYLEHKQNPKLGKHKCENCILDPFAKTRMTSIRDILVKYFVDQNTHFPCKIVNIFECPYEQGSKDHSLLFLGHIWKIVNDALDHAYDRTTYDNRKLIEADFEQDYVLEYNHKAEAVRIPGTVASNIGDLRLSQVPIESIKDIFDVITNRKKLDLILEQYIEAVADNYHYGKRNEKSEQRAESLRKMKKNIISLFMQVKNKIKLEDLRSVYDNTLEDEEKEKERSAKVDE